MELKERLESVGKYYGLSIRKLEEKCGLNRGNISNISGTIGIDKLSKIHDSCPEINIVWLMTGIGDMLKFDKTYTHTEKVKQTFNDNTVIPLVKENAVGGFWNCDGGIKESDIKSYYVIPKFRDIKVDFLIEVFGMSMYPKFISGDIVACSIIYESKFIQWNKSYLISTLHNGILLKKLKRGISENSILAISENKEFDPFEIPLNTICGIALVVGVIRTE